MASDHRCTREGLKLRRKQGTIIKILQHPCPHFLHKTTLEKLEDSGTLRITKTIMKPKHSSISGINCLYLHEDANQKTVRQSILISDKVDFRTRNITKNK